MPDNWKKYKLGDVAEVQNGFAFKSADLGKEGIPVVKIKNIVPPYVDVSDADYFNGEIDQKFEKYILRKGDLLISMTGSTVNVMSSAVGKMGRYRLDQESLLNQRAGKIYVKKPDLADFDFLYHYLNRYEVHYNLALNATGSANQANISPAQIKDIDLHLPPLPEQQAIASILSSLDDKIELNLQMNKTLEEMAMTLYKHWFIDFGPFQEGNFVESELGLIPEGWEVKRLEQVADIGSSKRIFLKEYVDNGIPFYRGKEIIQLSKGSNISTELFISNERYNEIKEKFGVPLKGDILISSVGTIGVSWLVEHNEPFYFKDGNLTWIKNFRDGLNGNFISQWLKSKETQEQIKSETIGSTQQALTITALKSLKLILPPTKASFIKDASGKFNEWNTLFLANKREIETLTSLRDTLLPKLISGEVRVKEAEQQLAHMI